MIIPLTRGDVSSLLSGVLLNTKMNRLVRKIPEKISKLERKYVMNSLY